MQDCHGGQMKDKHKPSLNSGVAFLFVIIRVNG